MTKLARLQRRGVVKVAGPDRVAFLNGLVSNDVAQAAPGRAVWAALLTPQGRYVTDFFIFAGPDFLALDAPMEHVAELAKKLSRLRLRAAVEIEQADPLKVFAAWDGPAPEADHVAPDPRLAPAGFRLLSETALECNAGAGEYDLHRLALGLPDGPPDLEPDKTLLLEAGFDELHGIAWDKGCYMGQELTARTKYRGLVKRRLIPMEASAPPPPPGTPVLAEGTEIGTLRSSAGFLGLASVRLDALQKSMLAGGVRLTPRIPSWMRLPA